MSKIPAINEIDANSPSQESTEVVVKATTVTPDINEIQETISASATIQEIDGTRKPTISEIYKIVNDGLFESTTNWWDYAYKLSQAQLNQDIISRLDNGVIGGGYSKGVEIITTTSNKVPNNTNVYSALKSDSLYPKKLNDEVINGIYDFLNGLTIGKPTAYTGGTWSVDQTGRTHLTTDYLYVRLKAIFETLQILNVDTIGGKLVISPAGSIRVAYVDRIKIDAPVFKHDENTDVWSISQVEDEEGNLVNETLNQEVYRCYFLGEQDGEEIDNKWKVGDQAQAKTFNVNKGTYHKVENSYLWRLVVNVSSDTVDIDGKKYHYVDLSQIDFDSGSDAPAPGDVLNQLGHRLNDTQRQTALVLNAVDNYAPSITLYAGVNYYTLLNKEYVEFGVYNGKAFFNVYGDMYIGDKGENPKTYIKYKNGKINIKANLEIGSSIGDKDLDQYIKENGGVDEETVKNLINNSQVIKDLQKQTDGAIETWFYEGIPTLDNLPAVDWTTNEIKKIHIGDLYYDQTTGYAYRFTKYNDDVNPYRWNRIKDNDIVAALDAANRAQATADGKMKVFYDETKPTNYKIGDMWVNATLEGKFNNDIVRAVADNKTFNANDWVLASRYSESIATIQKWTNEYETKFGIIKDQLDAKSETWYQVDDPSTDWTDEASHEGDIWYNTTYGTTNYWNGSAWEQMDIPKDVFDTIDGKSSIFIDSYDDAKAGTGVICKGYKERDLWILPEDATVNGVKYYKGDMLTAVSNNTNFDETNWKKKVRYVGQAELTSAIDIVNDKINTINNTTIPGINNKFNEFVKDGVLDSSEKARLTDLLNQASNEVAAVVDQVNNITTSKYLTNDNANKGKLEEANTVMNTAWTEYKNFINTLIDANTEITKVNIGEANTKYKNLQEKIKAVKQYLAICQADVLSGMGTDITSYKYLKDALNQTTEINGGLVLTSAIQLKDVDKKVTAGMNGIVKGDKTSIAAWYGGPMVDRDTFTSEELKTKVPGTDYAMSLLRHDGTGYLAGGNIHWNANGVLSGNFNSFILQGTSMVTMFYYIRLFYLHTANQDTTDFNNIDYVTPMKTFSRLSVLPLGGIEDGNNLPTGLFIGDSNTGGSFQIGNIILRTKSGDPNILEIVSADSKKTAHLGVQGGVSAYGTYTPSTGGGGGLNGTIIPYSTAIASDPQNEGSKIASASSIYKLHSRISSIETNGATSITVTGTGNAITSVSKNGTSITFTKGTTFLTSHQSLANYYTKGQIDNIANNKSDVGHTHNYLPYIGFNGGLYASTSSNGWGNTTGTAIAEWYDNTSGGLMFRKNNPSNGKMSMLIDGTVYINEGSEAVASQTWVIGKGYLTSHQSLADYAKKSEIPTTLPANGGNSDTVDGVHMDWSTNYTAGNHLAIWDNNGTVIRPIPLGSVSIGNADKLDGIHANGLLTALSNSDNGISITVGGTTKSISNISVNYASSAGSASKVYGQVGDTGSHELVRCDMNNDQFRIIAGSNGNNNGWAEIATADDGTEPIYVRQYTGVFSTLVRTLTLLDGSGNTTFPGTASASGFIKSDSNNNYVLLGGGDHKAISDFSTSGHTHPYLPLSGGTISGQLLINYDSGNYGAPALAINYYDGYTIDDYSIAQIKMGTPTYDAYLGLSPASKGKFGKVGYFMHIGTNYEFLWGTSGWSKRMALECSSGNLWVSGTVTASSFIGNSATSTKLQTPRTIWGQSFDGTADVNGTIYINNSNSINGAIRLNNNINSNARISAIDDKVIFNTGNAIRFGETTWDWDQWAGLKYTHSNKTIYLGLADGSAFNANSAQSNGTLRLAGITTITPDSGARIGGNGGALYLGNANNSSWVKVQDMCSQTTSDNWVIYQSGSAKFKNLTIDGGSTFNDSVKVNNMLTAKAIMFTTTDVNAFGTDLQNWDGSIAANVTNMFNGISYVNTVVEYSTDGGSSWKKYTPKPKYLFDLVNDNVDAYDFYLGKNTADTSSDANNLAQIKKNKLRVTVKVPDELYQELRWISVDVNNGVKIKCQVYFGNSSGTYTECVSKVMTGWAHKCDICISPSNVGNDTHRYVRLVFSHLDNHTDLRNGIINKIRALGLTKYSRNSDKYTLATTGHIYDYNYTMSVTFPKSITANGNILAKGGVTAYQSSDVRLKTNITKLNCLKVIKSIGGTYEFDYIRDHKHSIGFIAQNINNPLLKDIIAKDKDGYLKINYWNPKLISLAFGALTEIDDEVDKLKARVRELESEVEYLKNKDYALCE